MGTESKKKVKKIVPIDDKMQPAYDHYLNINNIINIEMCICRFLPFISLLCPHFIWKIK